MRYLLSVAAIVAIAFSVACGGSSKPTPAGTATPVSDEAFKAAAEQAASVSLLTLGDMPAGWTAKAHTKDPADNLDLPARCELLNEDMLPNALVNKDADDFEGANNQYIGSGVAVYRTAELASTNMALLSDTETSCIDEVAKAVKKGIAQSAQFDDLTTNVAEVKIPQVVSARIFRIAFSGHIAGAALAGHADVGFIVSGRIASGVSLELFEGSPSPPRIEDLLALLLKRAVAADATLPD